MARTHADREAEASGVRRTEVSQGVSSASAARTRTLGGETHEFRAVDYRPPQGVRTSADGRPEAVAPSDDAHLGRAAGVSSLRGQKGAGGRSGTGVKDPLPRRTAVAIAAVLVVLAAAVFAGGYFLASGMLEQINEGSTSEESASYATDAYTVLAVAGDDGSLACAYLGYVDTINDRVELCRLASNTLGAAGSSDGGTLGSSFGEGGLAGLVDDVARLAGVDVATAAVLTASQMDSLLLLSTGEGTTDASALAADVWDESQMITAGALRGLFATIAQISPENQVVMEAPATEAVGEDGQGVLELDQESWAQTVSGMRDTTGRS